MTESFNQPVGHAFISYVREDASRVDKLEENLRSAGIPVWRDTKDLWPGEDWALQIRRAIKNGSLAFIACFSSNSNARQATYQNEELILAIEEMRRRTPGAQPWLIPVRFDECELPEFGLGAGRTISSLQCVDLFGEGRERAISRLSATVLKVLGTSVPGVGINLRMGGSGETVAQVKGMLLEPSKKIELHDLVVSLVEECRLALIDDVKFPMSISGQRTADVVTRTSVERAQAYWQVVKPVVETLIVGCTWGDESHSKLWSNAARSVGNTVTPLGGSVALLNLRKLPMLILLYGAVLAAVNADNYKAFKAVAVDALVRNEVKGEIPFIGACHTGLPFDSNEAAAQVLSCLNNDPDGKKYGSYDEVLDKAVSGALPRFYTPVSDYLRGLLRESFGNLVPNDQDYVDLFNRTEIILSAVAKDVQVTQGKDRKVYTYGPWFGSFTWQDRYGERTLEMMMRDELGAASTEWLPLKAGLFGGSYDRALQAFDSIVDEGRKARGIFW